MSLLRDDFYRYGYGLAPEMINDTVIKMFKDYAKIIHKTSCLTTVVDRDYTIGKTKRGYSIQVAELFLLYFGPIYSKIINKELMPTYSFTRIYYKGSSMPIHTDRPACQYSLTINIDASSDEPWPIYFEDEKTYAEVKAPMFVPVMYLGERMSHWRNTLSKNYSSHVFLHYVDREDKSYKKYWYDSRKYIGEINERI